MSPHACLCRQLTPVPFPAPSPPTPQSFRKEAQKAEKRKPLTKLERVAKPGSSSGGGATGNGGGGGITGELLMSRGGVPCICCWCHQHLAPASLMRLFHPSLPPCLPALAPCHGAEGVTKQAVKQYVEKLLGHMFKERRINKEEYK